MADERLSTDPIRPADIQGVTAMTDLAVPRGPGAVPKVVRAGVLISAGYWSLLLAILTGLAVLEGWETWGTFAARCINTVLAVMISALIAKLVVGFRGGSFAAKCVLVLVLTLVGASVYFFVTFYIFRLFGGNQTPLMLDSTLRLISYWFAQFLGWSALLLALVYHREVQDRERQLSGLREQAFGAQMRALRYQINPHFLFNTLNALAALIEERELAKSERMVLSLSAFLRSTLSLDPLQDITLADELGIQARYLAIEEERFSDRLAVRIDVPDALRRAMIPSLILQPLVENAVKHGIGTLDGRIELRIRAEAHGGTLSIHVENDAPVAAPATTGTGVGLRNVAERLAARFGPAGRLASGRDGDVFRVTLTIPLRTA